MFIFSNFTSNGALCPLRSQQLTAVCSACGARRSSAVAQSHGEFVTAEATASDERTRHVLKEETIYLKRKTFTKYFHINIKTRQKNTTI